MTDSNKSPADVPSPSTETVEDPNSKPQDVTRDNPAATSTTTTTTDPTPANAASTTANPIHKPAGDAPPNGNGTSHGAVSSSSPSSRPSIDTSKPADFEGELATNNELPSSDLISKIENYIVLDKHSKSHTFKSLYTGPNVPRRVLVIFIRHFFCGNCQDYLRTLSESITPDSLLQLPISTFITVVGCGDPGLIDMYAETTGCPFPIYTDPTRSLFQALGMITSWSPGPKAAYTKRGLAKGAFDSITLALRKATGSGLLLKSGNFAQVGGEFLFEPLHVETPISTPQEERTRPLAPQDSGADEKQQRWQPQHDDDEQDRPAETKRVAWCHRMRTTRDHAEVPELMEILGLTGNGRPSTDEKRWAKAVHERKGTGLSMARAMSQMSNRQAEST